MADNLVARSMHDLGAAGWFGGLVMGAIAVNRAAADVSDPRERGRMVNGVWRRWWLVNLMFAAMHVLGGLRLTAANRGRLVGQQGVASTSTAKSAVMLGALGAATYSGWLGKRISDAGPVPLGDGTTPTHDTPDEVASALRQQAVLQWVIPALVGTDIVLGARLGEQQRPSRVVSGVLSRLNPAA